MFFRQRFHQALPQQKKCETPSKRPSARAEAEQQRSEPEPADGAAGDASSAASGTAGAMGGVGGAAGDAGPKPRKPGPGRQRIGREPMVSLSTKLELAVLQSIADTAAQANLSKSAVLRELAKTGLKRVLVAGYEKVATSPSGRS